MRRAIASIRDVERQVAKVRVAFPAKETVQHRSLPERSAPGRPSNRHADRTFAGPLPNLGVDRGATKDADLEIADGRDARGRVDRRTDRDPAGREQTYAIGPGHAANKSKVERLGHSENL